MLLSDTSFHLSEVVKKFQENPKAKTNNYIRCFLDRDKISLYVKTIIEKLKVKFPELEIIEGFVHRKVEKCIGDRSNLNTYKGLTIKVSDRKKLLEELKEPEINFFIPNDIILNVIETADSDCVMIVIN